MRHFDRSLLVRIAFGLRLPLVLAAALAAAALPAEEKTPPSPVRVHALPAAPVMPALVSAGAPAQAGDIAQRLHAARSAALSPGQPVPQAAPGSAAAAHPAPIAARIGRDVTLVTRPGAGTPMQIRGDILQERVASAPPGEDLEVATARAFLRANRTVLGLRDPDNELAVRQRFKDELGLAHLKFEQRWRGLSVWPGELIVHLDRQGHVYLMDGAYVLTPKLPTIRPVVGAADAAARARAGTPGGRRTSLSNPELLVYAAGPRAARLAWRVEVTGSPEDTAAVFIDAANGALLASIPLVMTENVVGSGTDLFGNTRPLNVWHESAGYGLIDTSKPMYRAGCNVDDLEKNCGAIYVLDANNTPPSSSPDASQAAVGLVTSSIPTFWTPADAVSAAYNFSWVYDYYKERHNRNSIDGNGGNILAVTRLGVGFRNAFWTDAVNGMFFGDADKYAGSLDVVGHEMTHGITSKTAGLVYQDQPGALNEALSDIFGEMVEYFATSSIDWLHNTGLLVKTRNLKDPSALEIIPGSGRRYPSRMSEYIGSGDPFLDNFKNRDNGGVHINSGIINHAYYQLAVGETGAIGSLEAEKIFYRALTVHLTKNAQFLDARLAAIQSADELFNPGSTQSQRTAQAFDGVEILGSTPAPPPPSAPPVSGADSVLFLASNGSKLTLSRRETGLGDPAQGVFLFPIQAADQEKIAVSGDGTLGFFVTSDNDACFFNTDGTEVLACLDLQGVIASVAMSRDENVYAFVLQSDGQRENLITVIDLAQDTTATYDLVAPATDAGTVGTVLFADTLDFTANRRFLFYDALNVVTVAGGGEPIGLWSISAIDFAGGQTYTVVPPIPGVDIENPAVARTSDNFVTFEADNQSDGKAAIYAANVQTGALSQVVVNVDSGLLTPTYTGNDNGIVYSYPDPSAPTTRSLALESLAGDRLTPVGAPQLDYLVDGAFPIIYRRGTYTGPSANCAANATTLCLSAGRFQVTATFTTTQGQQGLAQAVRLTADTGYFTFFDPSNVEVVVKVLNACGFNQKIWVFAGGLTDVATVITVTDSLTGVSKTYTNPQSTPFVPIQDTSAFGTCFAGSIADWLSYESVAGDAGALAHSTSREIASLAGSRPANAAGAESTPIAATPTACVQNAQTLCLSNGRYQVRTTFQTAQGQTGSGNAVRLTADTGYFWFFGPDNVEMVVKVLNACSPVLNNRYWVFAGGLTNVRVTTTVTDTNDGTVKTYNNALNTPFQPIQDTNAFATCP
jgi:bacillolysin